jgi:hypothetical protein
MLEENSSKHFSDGGAEGNSASGRIFRMRCGDVFRTQPIEITKDDFSAMHKNMAKPECRFTAPREPSGLEVKLGLNRVNSKGRNCWM